MTDFSEVRNHLRPSKVAPRLGSSSVRAMWTMPATSPGGFLPPPLLAAIENDAAERLGTSPDCLARSRGGADVTCTGTDHWNPVWLMAFTM